MKSKEFLDEISGKSINFLIGAGASAGVVPTLWIEAIGKSFEEVLSSNDYNSEQINVLYYLWFTLWIRKTRIEEELVENREILDKYYNFVNNLVKIINNEGYDKPKRVNIFTTNYDTFFELSFDNHSNKNRLSYFNDGSRGFLKQYVSTEDFYLNISHTGMSDNFQRSIPVVNLIKLHGSVTWQKDNERIKVSLNNEIFNTLIEKSEALNLFITELGNKNPSDQYLTDNFTINNFEKYLNKDLFSEDDLIEGVDRLIELNAIEFGRFKEIYDTLPIVSPTKRKFHETVFQQHYYQMLRLLSFELERKNSVLIVFGFSFADEHILEIVRRSMVNPNLKIYIISFDKKSQDSIKEKIGNETKVEYLPKFKNTPPGTEVFGNFDYLNSLLDGTRGKKHE
ncbi:SIR2 family protein [Erysipelothrix rhusiopathiae]|nr:SIR2 family protein [Erysipelothrix rhusiopathiae]